MKHKTLILLACLCLLTVTAFAAVKSSTTFDLETYEDPDGCFEIDLPVGWENGESDGMLVFVRKDLAHFGLMTVDEGADKTLEELMPVLLDGLKENVEEFVGIRTIEKPVVVSGGKTRIGHTKVAYKLEGETDFVTDLYVIESKANKVRYAIVSYIPADEEKDYRTLLEAVARSVVIAKQKTTVPKSDEADTEDTVVGRYTLKSYEDPEKRFAIKLPDGWTREEEEGMIFTISKGDTRFGLLDIADKYSSYSAEDALPLIVKKMKDDTTSFPGGRVVESATVLSGTGGRVARSIISYKEDGGTVFAYLYAIAGPDGKSRYGALSVVPKEDDGDYISLFDALTRSVTFADARKPVDPTDIELRKTDVVKPGSIKPLYWIRNGTEIIKDGKVVLTDDSGIRSACASWDGTMIAYSRRVDIVLLNLSTGKRTQIYKVAGKTTVQYKDSGSESEVVFPVGFSADNKKIYMIYQASSMFVGGNKLMTVGIGGGQAATVDTGVASAAVSRTGDLLVYKPGAVQFIGKNGSTWEADPSIRSMFVNGCGFTLDGKPFYYSSDDVAIIDSKGNEVWLKLGSTNIDGTPVVLGDQVVWSDGRRIMSNEGGTAKPIVIQGTNIKPFK